MTELLITGMSGTGKSTLLRELAGRGHRVVDLDDHGWSLEVAAADGCAVEQLWCEDRVAELLADQTEAALFVSGCAANQGNVYDRFDAVVLLSVPAAVLLERLSARDTNPFGKDPADRQRNPSGFGGGGTLLRSTATAEIDTTQPLSLVADAPWQPGLTLAGSDDANRNAGLPSIGAYALSTAGTLDTKMLANVRLVCSALSRQQMLPSSQLLTYVRSATGPRSLRIYPSSSPSPDCGECGSADVALTNAVAMPTPCLETL